MASTSGVAEAATRSLLMSIHGDLIHCVSMYVNNVKATGTPVADKIPSNYATDRLLGLLKQNAFDRDSPAYFIWEGNSMYLPLDSIKRMFTELRRDIRRFAASPTFRAW